jgi:hypothetical protein
MISTIAIGQQFERLTVIGQEQSDRWGSKLWKCQCICGKIRHIKSTKLRSGHTKSCGCYNVEQAKQRMTTHGKSRSRLHNIYNAMIQRCCNPKNPDYQNYGGRGIRVCDEWRDSFVTFNSWALQQPNVLQSGYSLDRINNDGGYKPENCRFSSRTDQNYNRRAFRTYTRAKEEILTLQKINWLLMQYTILSLHYETTNTA